MSTDKTCSNCGAALMPGDIFCGECGMRVQAPDYDVAPNAPLDEPSPMPAQEPPAEKETIAQPQPTLGDDVLLLAAPSKTGSENVGRVIVIIVAVVLLLSALCLCSLGGLVLVPATETETLRENLGPAALCCIPGIISGLLGAAAVYFGLKKPQEP